MSDSLQKNDFGSIQNGEDGYYFVPGSSYKEGTNNENWLSPEKVITLLNRYKWLIIAFLISGATAAWFYADSLTPVFKSKGTLLISSDESPKDELSRIITKTTGVGTSSTLENELQILRSKKFSRNVAQKVMALDTTSYAFYPVLWSITEDGEPYRATEERVTARVRKNIDFKLLQEDADVVEISYQSSSPDEAQKIVDIALEVYIENSTQQNRQAAASTAEFLKNEREKVKQNLEKSEERLQNYMDSTGIVRIDEQASDLVNKRANIDTELQRVNLELETIRQTIDNYEKRLEQIKPGLSEQFSEAIGPRINNLQRELADHENERMKILAKNPNLKEQAVVPPRLQFVNDQIERLKVEIKDLSQQLFTEDDEFVGMDGQDRARMVSEIQNRLVDLRIQQNQYMSRREFHMQQKEEMNSSFESLPEGMIQLAKLERDVRMNEQLYMNVSRQYADMSIWKESQFGLGRIIDRAEKPSVPVSPNKKTLMLLGIMLGGVLSAGFIFAKEFMDNSIKSVNEIRTHFPRLMFSAIPNIEEISEKERRYFSVGEGKIPDEMVMLYNQTSIVSESIRRLKNNIIYQNGVEPPKTIAITSPEKGDGKSTLVSNLGIAFAEEGYKTLLVGADFRRPKLHKNFGLTTSDGLYDYLNGSLSFQECLMTIQNTEFGDLKVIVAGKQTQNPEIISNSKKFKQFLKKMEEVFDVIILDTPPFGIISDSTALLKEAEATIVVVRHRKTNSEMLFRTIEELGRIEANVSGIILNDFKHKEEPYSAGYYQTMYGNYDTYVQ